MAIPDRDGRFKARIIESGLGETGTNKLLTFTAKYALTDWWNGEMWEAWESYCAEIIGYHYLVKRDGTPNATQVDALRGALGWNGDLAALHNTQWAEPVQVSLGYEEYQGKSRLKVQYVNPVDYEGASLKHASPDEVRGIVGKYGAMFRALGGGAPASSAPPKTKPAAPPPAKPKPAVDDYVPSDSTKAVKDRDGAWAYVVAETPKDKQGGLSDHFLAVVDKVVARRKRKDDESLTPMDWREVAEEASIPF